MLVKSHTYVAKDNCENKKNVCVWLDGTPTHSRAIKYRLPSFNIVNNDQSTVWVQLSLFGSKQGNDELIVKPVVLLQEVVDLRETDLVKSARFAFISASYVEIYVVLA